MMAKESPTMAHRSQPEAYSNWDRVLNQGQAQPMVGPYSISEHALGQACDWDWASISGPRLPSMWQNQCNICIMYKWENTWLARLLFQCRQECLVHVENYKHRFLALVVQLFHGFLQYLVVKQGHWIARCAAILVQIWDSFWRQTSKRLYIHNRYFPHS